MPAFLEKIGAGIFILRAGPQAFRYGDPYAASGTVVTVAGAGMIACLLRRPRVCEIRGFTCRFDDRSSAIAILRETQQCLRAAGFDEMQWERKRESSARLVKVRLERK
jgi:hypothetical protein